MCSVYQKKCFCGNTFYSTTHTRDLCDNCLDEADAIVNAP